MIAANSLCSLFRLVLLLPLLILASILTGCGMGAVAPSGSVVSLQLHGTVHGGQQPISGSTIQLWAAGTGGNGTAATGLISAANYLPGGVQCTMGSPNCTFGNVVSDGNGNFNITGDYVCPGTNPEVYITGSGGSPGQGNPANPALVIMAALGPCNNLSSTTSIFVDEVTTVAATWALAPFMTDAGHVASSSSNYSVGLVNAFANAQLLANTTNGSAATLPSNLQIQTSKLYALANAVAGCVNSDGTAACVPLFTAATPAGGSMPSNTLTAALNIVKNPGQHVGAVWMAIPTSPQFQPSLGQAPNDWTMSLTVGGGGLYGPTQLAVDTQGDVWVADYFGAVSEFSPQGTANSPAATMGAPTSGGFGNGQLAGIYGLAVDTNDNVFVTNEANNSSSGNVGSISILNGVTSGNTLGSLVTNTANSTPYFYDSSIQYPESLATDTNGNILIGNDNGAAASYVTVYNSSGALVRAGLGIPLGSGVFGVSADQAHGAWMSNNASTTVTHADVNGQVISASACCSEPAGVATDASGNAWVSNYGSNSISEVAPGCDTNTINRSSTCTGPGGNVVTLNQTAVTGLYYPQGILVDAGQNIWVSNYHSTGTGVGAAFVEIAGNSNTLAPGTGISPATGYGVDAGMVEPFGLATDPSGDIWISDEGSNQVVMFFGVATPTATPVGPTPTAP
jgi:hypothetical protein